MLNFNFYEIISVIITPILIGIGIYFGRVIHNIYKEKAGIVFDDEIINIKTIKEFLSEIRVSIRGTGTVLYDRMSFSHSALDAENVKIQNTLTLLTYTTTPSVVA